jgi:hypothetical protein
MLETLNRSGIEAEVISAKGGCAKVGDCQGQAVRPEICQVPLLEICFSFSLTLNPPQKSWKV